MPIVPILHTTDQIGFARRIEGNLL